MQLVVQTEYPINSPKCKGARRVIVEASLQESKPPLELNGHYYNYYTVDEVTGGTRLIDALLKQPSVLAAYLKTPGHPAL